MSNAQSQTLPAALELRRWLAPPVLLAGTFMVIPDFFIVNVAIPSLCHELNEGRRGDDRVDRRRLRADLCRWLDHRRAPRRFIWAPTHLRARAGGVHVCFGGLRLGAGRGAADRDARGSGRRRRAAGPAGAGHHRCHLYRRGPRTRLRHLRCGTGAGLGLRAGRRRAVDPGRSAWPRLARLLPGQHPDRGGGVAVGAIAGAVECGHRSACCLDGSGAGPDHPGDHRRAGIAVPHRR